MGTVLEKSKNLTEAKQYYETAAESQFEAGVNDPNVKVALDRVNQKFRLITHQRVSWPFILLTIAVLCAFIYMIYTSI